MFAKDLDDQEERDKNQGQFEAMLDESAGEPVLVLPLFQKSDQGSEPDGHAPNPEPIALSQQVEIGRLRVDRIGNRRQHNGPGRKLM